MNLMQAVTALVVEFGEASADDMLARLPGHTRAQIVKALHNAVFHDRIRLVRRGRANGGRQGSDAGVYGPRLAPTPMQRPVSSVWELGARA